ncbi:MAG TPA: division/cell wall cluster transcriptional repressor MraZ [Chitinophagaceae bacterium]|nr:division/cell wall cluster transcriptional repressor MraZ [Chitinophagaceae bacterium]
MGFIGKYEVSMDAKNRFLVPAALKRQFPDGGSKFIVSCGRDKCLMIYTLPVWERIEKELMAKSDSDPKVRDLKAVFYDSTYEVELDAAGRAMLNSDLVEHAELKKDVTLASYGDRIKIWDTERYKAMIKKSKETGFTELADSLGVEL